MLNRLMTQREQFLLLFVALALVVGAASVYFFRGETPPTPEAVPERTALPKGEAPAVDAAIKPSAPETPQPELPAPPPREIAPRSEPAKPAEPEEVAVAAMGAVESEGLYRLPADARVGDLLKKAGGATEEADLSDINLGARLIDGTTLTVPTKATAQVADGKITLRGAQALQAPNPPQYSRAYAAAHAGEVTRVEKGNATSTGGDDAPSSEASSSGGRINLNSASQAELETLPGIGPALAQRIIEYRSQTPFTTIEQLDEVSGFGEKRVAQLRPLVTVD